MRLPWNKLKATQLDLLDEVTAEPIVHVADSAAHAVTEVVRPRWRPAAMLAHQAFRRGNHFLCQ